MHLPPPSPLGLIILPRSHGELVTVELACYPRDAFYPPAEGEDSSHLRPSPNAQTRAWPDGGILWAFVNSEIRSKEEEVRIFLSPPPFVSTALLT